MSFNRAGELTWELRDYMVFIDGRLDLYDKGILIKYVDIHTGNEGWSEAMET